MKNKNNYLFDPDTGVATYIYEYEGQYFTGIAHCSPEDKDMQNEYTGIWIAQLRAEIKLLQYRRNELKHRLTALNQYYYSVNKSKKYDSHGYMENMLQHQIKNTQEELENTKSDLKDCQHFLREYIKSKDDFYKAVRKQRKKDNIN